MNQSLVLLVLIVLAVMVIRGLPGLLAKSQGHSGGAESWPLYAKKPLTQPEQVLYHRLVRALPDCIVLAQVQLSRFLGVKRGNNYAQWNNRINRMSADFVVCAADASVLAVIELDDASHDRPGRRERDAKKDAALRAANIRVIRWNVKDIPSAERIRTELQGGSARL